MEWMTTTLMIEDLRRGDDTAWAQFFARFRKPILALAIKMGVRSESADDVAQEAVLSFIGALRDGRYERGKGRLSSWLLGMARMKALHALEKQGVADARPEFLEADSGPTDNDLSNLWDKTWVENLVDHCMAAVRMEFDEKTVAAFEMATLQKLSATDAAARLAISENAVYIAKHRVLKRLRVLKDEFESVA